MIKGIETRFCVPAIKEEPAEADLTTAGITMLKVNEGKCPSYTTPCCWKGFVAGKQKYACNYFAAKKFCESTSNPLPSSAQWSAIAKLNHILTDGGVPVSSIFLREINVCTHIDTKVPGSNKQFPSYLQRCDDNAYGCRYVGEDAWDHGTPCYFRGAWTDNYKNYVMFLNSVADGIGNNGYVPATVGMSVRCIYAK